MNIRIPKATGISMLQSHYSTTGLASQMTTSATTEAFKNDNVDRQNKALQIMVNSVAQEYGDRGEDIRSLHITAMFGDPSSAGGKPKPIDCGRQQGDQLLTTEGVETNKIIVPFRLADPNKYSVEDIQNYVTEAMVHIVGHHRENAIKAGTILVSKGGSHNKLFEKWARRLGCTAWVETGKQSRGYRITTYNPDIYERSRDVYGITGNDIQIVAEDIEPEAKPSRPGGKRATWTCSCVRDDVRGISPTISCPDGSIKNITCGDCGQKFTKQS